MKRFDRTSIVLLGSLMLLGLPATADDLPRRAHLGVAAGPLDDAARAERKIPKEKTGGIVALNVFPGGSGEAAGLHQGDAVVAIDGKAIAGPTAFVEAFAHRSAGEVVRLEVIRDGKSVDLHVTLKARPPEKAEGLSTEYGSVESRGAQLRTIVTRPAAAGERRPGILLIQGIFCGPVDNPLGPLSSYRRIAEELARAGFVVMRAEKPGCGDSGGGPCPDIDFQTELDGFRQAARALKGRADVDPSRVFLFGHSLGGIMAPLVAEEVPVRGISVFGTVSKPWFEYLNENTRRQNRIVGTDPATIDRNVRDQARFTHELFDSKRSPAQIAEAVPELREWIAQALPDKTHWYGRHFTFYQQLNDQNMPAHWAKVDAQVLAIHGHADAVAFEDDHAMIAEVVNTARPGRGRFVEMPGIDHGFSRAIDPEASLRQGQAGGEFNPEIIDTLKRWMLEAPRAS
jgi:uncharacterized protein